MKLTYLIYFIYEVNMVLDRGEHQDISIADVEGHIEAGDLVPWLQARLSLARIDLSLLLPDLAKELNDGMMDILGAYKGKERRKWGIERSGLCLLIAWTAELIQRRQWRD
jgi:hypothetical protein